MTLDDLDKALKAFRRRLLKNGTWEDGAIELRVDNPDWDWVTFSATVHLKGLDQDAIINASWDTTAQKVRLRDWEGMYKNAPWAKYDVL